MSKRRKKAKLGKPMVKRDKDRILTERPKVNIDTSSFDPSKLKSEFGLGENTYNEEEVVNDMKPDINNPFDINSPFKSQSILKDKSAEARSKGKTPAPPPGGFKKDATDEQKSNWNQFASGRDKDRAAYLASGGQKYWE